MGKAYKAYYILGKQGLMLFWGIPLHYRARDKTHCLRVGTRLKVRKLVECFVVCPRGGHQLL